MNLNLKTLILIIIAIIVIISVYFVLINNEETIDDQAPTIDIITGNITGKKGEIITIFLTFTDNINVTKATLYYKSANANDWNSKSILNGSVDILLNSNENLNYYVIIDDAAGNGPVGDPSTDGSVYYTIIVLEEEEFIHTVLIEEGSFNDCLYCPRVANILHELFNSGDYNFYYVSLIKTNEKATARLDNEYNLKGLPTTYIDGGFNVIMGGLHEKSEYAQAIREAEARDVPEIKVTVTAEYVNDTDSLKSNILVENNENNIYNGRLRVYLTEIVSRWTGPEGEPYYYGFLDYIVNEDVSVSVNNNVSFSKTRDISDLDPENLMIIAAVFNSEKKQAYSDPINNENSFNAYYSDAVDGTKVVEGGNLPPLVGISRPTVGKIHIFGRPIIKSLTSNTIIIGSTAVKVNASDDSKIEKVEFYIDGKLKHSTNEEPYKWSFRKIGLFRNLIRKHTIEVIAYDDQEKTSTTSINVIALFF